MVSGIHFTSQVAQSQALTSLLNQKSKETPKENQTVQKADETPVAAEPETIAPVVVETATQPIQSTQTQPSQNKLMPLSKDIFAPANAPAPGQETIQQTLIKSGISLASVVVLMAIMAKMMPKIMSSSISSITDKGKGEQVAESLKIWEDLKGAQKIDDMVLPNGLRETLIKIKNAIANPETLQKRGGKTTNSLLLYGPPGTGKTTFAKALAKEFPDARFAAIDITKLNSKYHGETGKRINAAIDAICKAASENPDKKFFVFIDEIDSVMMVDDGVNGKLANDILNEFKKCFTEKLGKQKNIITIGATNFSIDVKKGTTQGGKFLDRPMLDRFEQKILVDLPTSEQLQKSMAKHYRGCTLVDDTLKNGTDDSVKKLCDFLSAKKHNVSFRTMNSIYNDSASMLTGSDAKVTLVDILKTIEAKKAELAISDNEWNSLLATLGVTL